MSAVSFAPPGESASDLWAERSVLDGTVLAGVAYGVHFTLFTFVVPLLLKRWAKNRDWFLLSFTTVMFILGTIHIGANSKVTELAFIDNRNFPGGPNGYLAAHYNAEPHPLVNIMGVISLWLADGLLIYRCLIIFNFRYWIVLIPAPVYLANIVFGILAIIQSNKPAQNVTSHLTVEFALAYFSLSLGLNVLLTWLIVMRLLMHRHRARKHLGANHATPYTSIAAMLVESSALYSTVSLVFIISYAKNSPVQNLVLPVLGQVQMISPLLIVLRVALGRGWSRRTADRITTSGDLHVRSPSTGITAASRSYPHEYPLSSVETITIGYDRQKSSVAHAPVFTREETNKTYSL